jgi:steroid 5-alpha reductase family enzyme
MLTDILFALLLSIFVQVLFFLIAIIFKTDKVTDLSYGLTFILIALYFFGISEKNLLVQFVVTILVFIWGARLSTYLFIRILKIKRDERFNAFRDNFWKVAQFWLFQALAVWIILLPTIVILTTKTSIATGYFVGGILVWLVGFIIEAIADQQKFAFKNKLQNKNRWIEDGLWRYSRHPNYFGEMLCWWGIYIISIPTVVHFHWYPIISPLFITCLLCFVSGIPPLEKKYDKVYADNDAYQTYKKRTSILLLLPQKRNSS